MKCWTPFETDVNHLTKPRHLPIPQASFIINRKTIFYCQHANCLTYFSCSLQGHMSCVPQHPFISTSSESNPSSRWDICFVLSWSHEMTLPIRVLIAPFDFLSFSYFCLEFSPHFSVLSLDFFFFFSFFLASVGLKHCTILKSLGIVAHEWAFGKHLLCFHEEVPKASFRAWDPIFIMYGKYWRKRG